MTRRSVNPESTKTAAGEPNFSAARALEAIGERWALLVIRDAVFDQTTSFSEFRRRLSIAPDVLSARLAALVGAGLMYQHSADAQEYRITDRGRNLAPVILALTSWEDGWEFPVDRKGAPSSKDAPSGLPALPGLPAPTSASDGTAQEDPSQDSVGIEIFVLGTFVMKVGGVEIGPLPLGTQRLLAFLALHDRAITRSAVAGTMWPDTSEERAGIRLASDVDVDLQVAQALAHRLLSSIPASDRDLDQDATTLLATELLPDWYDEWVVPEAEDWRQLRVGALEAQATSLLAAGRFADSANAARAAMKVDPLRESATCCLVRAHIAEGNQSEALRALDQYSELLWNSLGLKPTTNLTDLMAGIAS